MAHFLTLQSVDEVLERLRFFSPCAVESLALAECCNRILARPFYAPENLPGFNRSTMDGFAVRAKDVFGASEGMPALLDCVGECPMGEVPAFSVGEGQTARIWTGGMLPAGADAVVMLEYSRQAGPDQVELTRPVAPQDNVILEDEDTVKGSLLLAAGRVLRPQELGLLAALGQDAVPVFQRPRVAIISSGDEIVPVTQRPKPGQVRDINTYTLAGLVQACGGESRLMGIAGDDRDDLIKRIKEAADWADVVLVSGGSSAGQRDYTVHAFEALGAEILAHGVAISPGKPLIMARKGNTSLWGLPGHAASALVCAEVFIKPLLHHLCGMLPAPAWKCNRQARLTRSIASTQGRRDYIRVSVRQGEEKDPTPTATPVLGKSGLITTLVDADALVICPEDQEGLYAGQVVELYELL